MNEKNSFTKRYLLIDAIRGFAITNMVIFHFLYDVYIIYGKNTSWYALPYIHVWQQTICWTFILIAGFVWQLGGSNNFRRGIFFNICGLAISFITWVIIPTEAIRFGILNFMGCAVLLTIPLRQGLDLILHTPGGDIAATESLVYYLKKLFGNDIRVLYHRLLCLLVL